MPPALDALAVCEGYLRAVAVGAPEISACFRYFGSLRALPAGGLEQFFQCDHDHTSSDEGYHERQDV
jgi:hypothetical protein